MDPSGAYVPWKDYGEEVNKAVGQAESDHIDRSIEYEQDKSMAELCEDGLRRFPDYEIQWKLHPLSGLTVVKFSGDGLMVECKEGKRTWIDWNNMKEKGAIQCPCCEGFHVIESPFFHHELHLRSIVWIYNTHPDHPYWDRMDPAVKAEHFRGLISEKLYDLPDVKAGEDDPTVETVSAGKQEADP